METNDLSVAALVTSGVTLTGILLTQLYNWYKSSQEAKIERAKVDQESKKFEHEAGLSVSQLRLEVEQRVWERIKEELEEAYTRNDLADHTINELRKAHEEEHQLRIAAEREVIALRTELEKELMLRSTLQKENSYLKTMLESGSP